MKPISHLILLMFIVLSASKLMAQPNIGGYNVYYGHLHNHSNISDGTGTPDAAYNYAKTTGGLDFFSLADHSGSITSTEWTTMKNAANAYNQEGVFTAFWGFEWSDTYRGHVAVINSDNYITTASPYNTFEGLCNWLNSNECVAFFNHPGRQNSTGLEFSHFSTPPSDKFIGMELWNKTDRFNIYYYTDGYYTSDGNKGYFDEALARGWKIGAAGSEDNHSGTWGSMTPSKVAVLAPANNRTEIMNALKARRFFTTYDKNLALSFKMNGQEMGATIPGATYQMQIQASDANGEIFARVELLKNGAVTNTWTPNSSSVNITQTLTCNDGEYYYVRVKQADSDEAISSPIHISGGMTNQSPTVAITSPLNNSQLDATSGITLSAEAGDTDGSVVRVEFYNGNTLIGEVTSSPWVLTWNNPPAGNCQLTARATDNGGAFTISPVVKILVYYPGQPVSVTSAIASGQDDAEEAESGSIYLTSTDVELVYDSYNSYGNQKVGLRFTGLSIPQGAVISNAFIQFTCDEVTTGTCSLTIKGEASDNPEAFSSSAFNVSSRPTTTSSAAWEPVAWNIAGEAGVSQQTPDLSIILGEIINRPGYLPSNAISFIISGSGTRTAEAYEGLPSAAARLTVTFTYGSTNNPPQVNLTAPLNGSNFIAPASVLLQATTSDDGEIAKVEFFSNGVWLGEDVTSPYEYFWGNVPEGTYLLTAKATDNQGATAFTSANAITVTQPQTTFSLTKRIEASSDDAEQYASGTVITNSTALELVYATKSTGNQLVGLRFQNISIPREANVTKAYIQFTTSKKGTAATSLTIKGEKSANAGTFSTAKNNLSGRPVTTAAASWIPAGWSTIGASGAAQQTPDLKAIVQEIVSQENWGSGNSLAFILSGTGTRYAYSFEGSPSKSALLCIEYEYAGPLMKKGEIRAGDPSNVAEPVGSRSGTLTCYPVPFTDMLQIHFKPAVGEKSRQVELYNASGIMVKSITMTSDLQLIQTKELHPGLYVVKVMSDKGSYAMPVIRE